MLEGKIVVVTGGAGLIGSKFVEGVANSGGIAIAADINTESLEKLVQQFEGELLGKVVTKHLDITSKESIIRLIDEVTEEFGTIDAVVNNAYPRNKNYGKILEEVTYEDFCENTSLHLGGYFLVAQQFCIAFKKLGGGNVVNMASIYGEVAPRFDVYEGVSFTMPVEYAAIKSAIVHLTKYFARYFSGNNIRVNCLSPGGILNGQEERFLDAYNSYCTSKGMLEPKDVLGALKFLLSDESRYMNGQSLLVDDGYSL